MINQKAFELILKSEGGLLEGPSEPGGAAYAGITQQAYSSWLMKKCKIKDAPTHVKDIAGDTIGTEYEKTSPLDIPKSFNVRLDVVEAFYNDYFEKYHADLLPECIQYIYLDFATNAGNAAVKIIQRLSDVDDDGKMGPGTREGMSQLTEKFNEAIKEDPYTDNDLIDEFDRQKREHYNFLCDKNPEKFGKFRKGWLNRCDAVKAELVEYYNDDNPTPSAHEEEHEDIDPFIDDDPHTDINATDNQRTEETEQRLAALEHLMKGVAEKLSVLDTLTDKISVISDLQEKVDSISNPIDAAKKIKKGFFG